MTMTTSSSPVLGLAAKNILVKHSSTRPILDHMSLTIKNGEVVALLGANGAGKSTLSTIMAGDKITLPLLSGEVTLNSLNVLTSPASQLARCRSVLPQYPSLHFELSVHDVIEMGTYPFPELSVSERDKLILQACEWAEVSPLIDRIYQDLSGGEKQRIQFARILVQLFASLHITKNSPYCLLDEPTSSLDPKHQQSVLKCLKRLAHEFNIGILLVLHDVNLAALYCDRLALLAEGKLIAEGVPNQVLTTDNLEKTYGIRGQMIPHPLIPDKVLVVWGDSKQLMLESKML